ncbi:MAG: MFS transporter [bacterium]|nr:MFS transporter [bacterium]
MGIYIPYFNLYLHHAGMSHMEIGVITASVPLVRMFSPPLWGYVADRYDRRGITGRALWLFSVLIFSLLLFIKGFYSILFIVVLFTFFWAATLPIAEASAVATARVRGIDYGRMRFWGTIGFICLVWIMGPVLDRMPVYVVLWGLISLLLVNFFISFLIPMEKAGSDGISIGQAFIQIKDRDRFIFLAVSMLMLFSHSAYYAFFSIYLESLDYSKTMIGVLWGLGPLGELAVMFYSGGILKRYGTLSILFFSLLMAALRWAIFASADQLLFLILGQLLHAFTFGTFHIASMKYIETAFPDNMKNTAQALYNSSSFGTGLVLGTLVAGYLYEGRGLPFLFMLSSLTALAAAFLLSFMRSSHSSETGTI